MNTTIDVVAADNQCSLREAISAANSDSVPFVGPGECAAGSGSDTVALPAGTLVLGINGPPDDTNAAGDLDILGSEVTIAGAGAVLTTIDANHIDRVLDVRPGRTATIRGVTITGGRAPNGSTGISSNPGPGQNSFATAGGAGGDGGGIRNAGILTVLDATVSGNAAGAGGMGGSANGGFGNTSATGGAGGDATAGDGGNGGSGGGIFNSGALTLTRVVVTNNAAGAGGAGNFASGGQGGGGISGSGGSGGDGHGGDGGAGGAGGGVAWAGGGTLAIAQSSISGNSAGAGGAGGLGQGGDGGVANGSPATGGFGAAGVGGTGGAGGDGAGVSASNAATLTNVLLESNTAGAGGKGGNASGGAGGHVLTGSGNGGNGSLGQGGGGGSGGSGGGIAASSVAVTNVTIAANVAGAGGASGSGSGGDGGDGASTGDGGDGGFGNTFDGGGDGGSGGGLELAGTSSIRHATITSNGLGSGGAAGLATGGDGGSGTPPGDSAGSGQGPAGSSGTGGAAHAAGGTSTLQNSIAAANATPSCAGITDGGHNISFPDAGCPGANVDPKLGALADNGGPTKTRALEPGSPALDAVPAGGAGCAATDQRGVARPQEAACDIGAYEHAPPGVTTGDATGVSSGAATLQGQVNPNARTSSYHFEFGTTTAYGTSTAAQTTGAGVSPEAVAATVTGLVPGTTYHFRLVATNADGTTAGADRTFVAQGPPDTTRPRFLSAALRPTVFAVNRRGRAEVPVAAAAKRGTTFRYRLSENARVVFTIARALPGRRVGRACRKPTARNRTRPRCTRYVRVRGGRFAATARAGANRKRFSGRIGRRALKPGRYRASLVATDAAGNASRPPKRLAFRVVRG